MVACLLKNARFYASEYNIGSRWQRGGGGGVTVSKYGTTSWTILFRDGLTPFKTKKVTAWLIHRLSILAICMLASYYNNYYTSNLFRIIEGSVAV